MEQLLILKIKSNILRDELQPIIWNPFEWRWQTGFVNNESSRTRITNIYQKESMDSTSPNPQCSTVAILCPGPSLKTLWNEKLFEEYEEVVAVNTAGHVYRHHWLAAVDRHVILPFLDGKIPLPKLGFLTHKSWIARLKKYSELTFHLCGPYFGDDIRPECEKFFKTNRCGYTFPNALWFARSRYKTQSIHVYGFDCAIGKPDICNVTGDRKRNRFLLELNWIKEYWHKDIIVNSDIDPKILDWLNDGNKDFSDPPLPPK